MGPRRIEHQLDRLGLEPVPSRPAIYRCLKRHVSGSIVADSQAVTFHLTRPDPNLPF